MKHSRPVNLSLTSLRFPPMAIASILHRLSGILLFILLPIILYFWDCSLCSDVSFQSLLITLQQPLAKLVLWGFSAAFFYHLIAGIRHLCMDMGLGESLSAGRASAIIVIGLGVLMFLGLGVWLW